MNNQKIYCVTNKKLNFLEKTSMKLVGVGKEEFSNNYLKCDTKINIYHKEKILFRINLSLLVLEKYFTK